MCGVTTIDTKRNGQWQYICDQETRQNTTLIMHMHIEPEARSERKFDYSCWGWDPSIKLQIHTNCHGSLERRHFPIYIYTHTHTRLCEGSSYVYAITRTTWEETCVMMIKQESNLAWINTPERYIKIDDRERLDTSKTENCDYYKRH